MISLHGLILSPLRRPGPGMSLRWVDLTSEERIKVVEAVRIGYHGDLLLSTNRWYRIKKTHE